jgi:hypothetical protein
VLCGGVSIPLSALELAWDLEARGMTLAVDDDGWLLVTPRRLLTQADEVAIAALRGELVRIVHYCRDHREMA